MHKSPWNLLLPLIAALALHLPTLAGAYPAEVPRTGQTTCHDANGAVIACAGTGQDGAIQAGAAWPMPRFVDNGDGTVTDKLTGLEWTKNANPAGGSRPWQGALEYVMTINTGGHSDWRLPNVNELESLVDAGMYGPAVPMPPFSNMQVYYWSSTSQSSFSAWVVDMFDGVGGYGDKADSGAYFWPVRAGQCGIDDSAICLPKTGQTKCYNSSGSDIDCAGTGQDGDIQAGVAWPNPRLIDNGDGTVTDSLTGLEWDAGVAVPAKTWQEALDYVKTLSSGSHNDWRLPNKNELRSLYSSFAGHYWSSTSYAPNTKGAWNSIEYYSIKTEYEYVQPVRAGQVANPLISTTSTTIGDTTTTSPVPDTGDTNEPRCNPHSYTDLGNGIIRDNVTGLMWQQATASGTTWQGAVMYCAGLRLGGYSDWRLPTVWELSTLVDSSSSQHDLAINTKYFPDTKPAGSHYWTSTEFALDPGEFAWSVDFWFGEVGYVVDVGYVRAVRGNQAINIFLDNGDSTITDTSTGLMWQQATAPGTYTWDQAQAYCDNLTLGGNSDWRLPNKNELQSIVNYNSYKPAAFTAFFPDTASTIYWSSTTTRLGYPWAVDFSSGEVNFPLSNIFGFYVRAVRAGQCGALTKCPAKQMLGNDNPNLENLRNFRDGFMKRSDQGSAYTKLYYRHALEISSLLEAHPELKEKTQRLIVQLLPTVQALLAQKEVMIDAGTVMDATALLDNLSALGSPSLKADLVMLKKEMQSGRLFEELNISVAGR